MENTKIFWSLAVGAALVLAGGDGGAALGATTRFRVELFGLDDPLYRGPDGVTKSEPANNYTYDHIPSPREAVLGDSYQLATGPYPGYTPWVATSGETTPLGLSDAAHVSAEGRSYSSTWMFSGASNIAGYSNRFDGAALTSAWHYDGTTSRQIGLWNAAGKPESPHATELPNWMNSSGQVAGEWQSGWQFTDANYAEWNWVFDGATTHRVGLPKAGEPADSWVGINYLSAFNAAGQASGISFGGNDVGSVTRAWFFDGAATHELGLTDARHTNPWGGRLSNALALTDSGIVIGASQTYTQQMDQGPPGYQAYLSGAGQTAWVYRDGATRVVGLLGPEYVSAQGQSDSTPLMATNNGWIAGISRRFDSDNDVPWIDDGTTTTAISLPGIDLSQSGAWIRISINSMSDAGRIVGTLNPTEFARSGVFESQHGATRWLGLFGDEYRAPDGTTANLLYGQAGNATAGFTPRYQDGAWIGQTAWIDDGATTQPLEIALPGDDPKLERQSYVRDMNAAGQVLGVTYLTDNGDEIANRPWLFDPIAGLTPIKAPAGDLCRVLGLTDDGWVYGVYGSGFEADGSISNPCAFVWQKSAGWIDLDNAARLGSPEAMGSWLSSISGGGDGAFVGMAATDDGGTRVFRAVLVPEPGAGAGGFVCDGGAENRAGRIAGVAFRCADFMSAEKKRNRTLARGG